MPAPGRSEHQVDGAEMVGSASARSDEGVLPLVMPGDVETVWVADDGLGARLKAGGYRLADHAPDVVIVRNSADLSRAPSAPRAVAIVDGLRGQRLSGGRHRDAVERLRAHARMRRDLRSLRRLIRKKGQEIGPLHYWDGKATIFFDEPAPHLPLHRPQRYPRRAIMSVGVTGPTLLERALKQAADEVKGPGAPRPSLHRVVLSEGSVVALSDLGVLRVGLGAGSGQVKRPAQSLRALRGAVKGTTLEPLVPALLATGTVDQLTWSLEQRLDGDRATPPLREDLLDSCSEVLVVLHELPSTGLPQAKPLPEIAALLSPFSQRSETVRRLAAEAERKLAPLRRGIHHGDFWSENLLVRQGRLTGLVDWDSATGHALPFLDLMHLQTSAVLRPGFDAWGQAFTEHLLPMCAQGGDSRLRRYAHQVGIDSAPTTLWAASIGYWLGHVGYQVSRYAQRSQDRAWLRKNLDDVAAKLDAVGRGGVRY